MLFYRSFGHPSSPTVILLHGFLGSHRDYAPLIDTLQSRYHCIVIDLPGHGQSLPSCHVIQTIEAAFSFLSTPVFLVGYSLGGRIALQIAQRSKISCLGLSLLSAHPGLQSTEEKHKRWCHDRIWHHRLLTLSPLDFLAAWYAQPIFASLHKHPTLLSYLIQKRVYQDPLPLAHMLLHMSLSKQPSSPLPSVPILSMYGEEDLVYQKIYATMPQSIMIRNAGHTLLEENPDAVCATLQTWMEDILTVKITPSPGYETVSHIL